MPNGADRNWIRLRAALEGFFGRYGRWPKRVRIDSILLADLRDNLFLPESWRQLKERLEFVVDKDDVIIADDGAGNAYSYYEEGFPSQRRIQEVEEWLGVAPDGPASDD